MKFRIGYRTIKTAAGTAVSIMLAEAAGLDNYVSAGIMTILCIQATKKGSLRTSADRIIASLIAMAFSSLLFEIAGYYPLVIGLVMLLFIPAAVVARVTDGIVSSSVIILHIYSAGEVTIHLILNELGIVLIGVGVALAANFYMPSVRSKLKDYQQKIDHNLKLIFIEIAKYLKYGNLDWGGKELPETAKLIREAKLLALRDVENNILRGENLYYEYFSIREKQFDIIERVLPAITSISTDVKQAAMIADYVEEIARGVNPGNRVVYYLEKLNKMRCEFEQMDLPKTREEFEARAALLQFVNEMESYLLLKRPFKGIDENV